MEIIKFYFFFFQWTTQHFVRCYSNLFHWLLFLCPISEKLLLNPEKLMAAENYDRNRDFSEK